MLRGRGRLTDIRIAIRRVAPVDPPLTRGNVYTRLSYDITPNAEVYLTYNWSQVGTSNIPNPDAWLGGLPGI